MIFIYFHVSRKDSRLLWPLQVDTVLTATELLDLLREAGEGCCGGCGKSACEATDQRWLGLITVTGQIFLGYFKKDDVTISDNTRYTVYEIKWRYLQGFAQFSKSHFAPRELTSRRRKRSLRSCGRCPCIARRGIVPIFIEQNWNMARQFFDVFLCLCNFSTSETRPKVQSENNTSCCLSPLCPLWIVFLFELDASVALFCCIDYSEFWNLWLLLLAMLGSVLPFLDLADTSLTFNISLIFKVHSL